MTKRSTLYFKEAKVTLEACPQSHTLLFVWQGKAMPSDYQAALKRGLHLLHDSPMRYWISDFKQMEISPNVQYKWVDTEWVNEAFSVGLEKFLVVVSPVVFDEGMRQKIAKRSISPQDKVAFFCNTQDARQYLSQLSH